MVQVGLSGGGDELTLISSLAAPVQQELFLTLSAIASDLYIQYYCSTVNSF